MSEERAKYETQRKQDEAEYLDYLYAKLRTDRGVALAENDRLREKNKALHRRAQRAESIIEKSGILENRPKHGEGRSLGRALANYAAAKAERELAEARAEIEHLQTSVITCGKILNDTINGLRGSPPELHSWSTHDTADVAQRVVEERDRARAERDEALAELEWLRRRGGGA